MRFASLFPACIAAIALSGTLVLAQEPATGGGQSAPPAGGGGNAPVGGAPTGGSPGGLPGGGNLPGQPGGRPTSPFPQERQPDFGRVEDRPIFLSGKVMTEDGGPPPEPATIERICAGRGTPIPEGYTDSKGRFSFQVGQRMGMMPDASIGNADESFPGRGQGAPSGFGGMGGRGGVNERDLQTCELRASLPGYRSTVVTLAGRRSLDNPDVGTIILRRLADVTGFTTSATTLMAPKDAKKAFEKARNARKKNKLPEAQKEYETALSLHPKFAEAYFELAQINLAGNDADAARANFNKAIESDSKFVSPYLGIAQLDASQQKWDLVKATTEKVIQLNRYDFPAAFFYGAVANYNLRDNETAEKLCRSGIEIDQYHRIPKMSHLLGVLLAEKQDFKGASDQLQAYLKFAPKANDAENVKKQLAEIQGRIAQAPVPATTPQ
jgi:Tfp pilus assembly protein PilF